jgi:hypothetical protein
LARIMTHPQSHHGQPPTTIQVGKKRAKQAGKVRIPKRTLRKSRKYCTFTVFPINSTRVARATQRWLWVRDWSRLVLTLKPWERGWFGIYIYTSIYINYNFYKIIQCSPDCNYLFWAFDSVLRVFIRKIDLLNFRAVVDAVEVCGNVWLVDGFQYVGCH